MGDSIREMLERTLSAARAPLARAATMCALLGAAALTLFGALAALLALGAHAAYLEWGWPGALCVVAGALSAGALALSVTALVVRARWRRRDERERAEEAMRKLQEELDAARAAQDSGGATAGAASLSPLIELAVSAFTGARRPGTPTMLVAAGIAGAGLAFIGPKRAIRLLLRAWRVIGAVERFAESAADTRRTPSNGVAGHTGTGVAQRGAGADAR